MYQQNGETNVPSQGNPGQTNQMYFPLFMNQQSNQAVQYLTGELISASCYAGGDMSSSCSKRDRA